MYGINAMRCYLIYIMCGGYDSEIFLFFLSFSGDRMILLPLCVNLPLCDCYMHIFCAWYKLWKNVWINNILHILNNSHFIPFYSHFYSYRLNTYGVIREIFVYVSLVHLFFFHLKAIDVLLFILLIMNLSQWISRVTAKRSIHNIDIT